MNKRSRHLIVISVLGLFLALMASSQSAVADSIVIRSVGPLEQECPASGSVDFGWFIYNDDNKPYLLELFAAPTSGSGWSSEFEQPIYVIRPGEGVFVNLTVSATNDVTSKTVVQNITFQFTDLGNITAPNESRASLVTTKFVPTWGVIAPGKNKLLGRFENPLPAPFDDNYVTFAINVGIWAGIAVIFAYVVNPAIRYLTRKTKTDLDDRILKALHAPIFALVIIYGLVSSLSILPLAESEVAFIFELYGILLIAILTFVIYKIFKEVIIVLGKRWAARTTTEIDDVLIPVIEKIGGIVILIFGAIGIVNYMGYDITFLLAGVGVFGLVIAFAAQDALSNFFSGIFMLLDRPFVEGDFVQISTGELCRVEKIGIRSTRLYDVFQNNRIVLPNNKLVNDKIVNLTEPDMQGVAEIVVNVAPDADIGKVERTLIDIARSHREVIKDAGKEPAVRLSSFAESSLEFKLFVWVGDFMTKWRVAHELRKEISRRFADEGIEIAVPRRTVYVKEKPAK